MFNRSHEYRSISRLLSLVMLVFVTSMPAKTNADTVSEYIVKVKFIHNFIRFTRWPDDSKEIKICIYGTDPFGLEIDKLAGKIINDRTITIIRTQIIEEVRSCHLVFLNIIPPKQHLFERALTKLNKTHVLTISDANDAVKYGVMIELNITDNKVAFKVNHTAAKSSDLKISAKLLRLAKEVI